MKKAFSTLGCPTWSFREVVSVAKDIGMHGIEIRGLGYQMYAPALSIFSDKNIEKTVELLKRTSLEIPMLTSSCDLSVDDFDNCLNEANDYIELARKIGTPYVRIMCESSPSVTKKIDIDLIAKRYAKICDIAKGTGVCPLIETNACLADSSVMLEFLDKADTDNAGVLWDIHHPFRYFGESIELTYSNLKNYIAYIHVKDSVMVNGKVEYRMMGYGDIPLGKVVALLNKNAYSGYVSLEWVKRWNPGLEESGVAFAQYANYIGDLQYNGGCEGI